MNEKVPGETVLSCANVAEINVMENNYFKLNAKTQPSSKLLGKGGRNEENEWNEEERL